MQQLNFFGESAPVLPITYYPDFLGSEQANELYQHCLKLEWQQNQTRIAGFVVSTRINLTFRPHTGGR